jgi:hypothetical protein
LIFYPTNTVLRQSMDISEAIGRAMEDIISMLAYGFDA